MNLFDGRLGGAASVQWCEEFAPVSLEAWARLPTLGTSTDPVVVKALDSFEPVIPPEHLVYYGKTN